jgi:hypothetical protein
VTELSQKVTSDFSYAICCLRVYLGFQCLDHPPYSLDLAPSDYHLFPGLKNQLKGLRFSSDTEVIAAAETWLERQLSVFLFEWLAKVRAMS